MIYIDSLVVRLFFVILRKVSRNTHKTSNKKPHDDLVTVFVFVIQIILINPKKTNVRMLCV